MNRLADWMLARRTIVLPPTPTILALIVIAALAVGLAVARQGGSFEAILPTRSGLGCFQNPGCPPLPKTILVFRPAVDLGLAAGVLTLIVLVVAWTVIRDRTRHRAEP